MKVKSLSSEEEIKATFPVMRQLRPHQNKGSYLETVRRMRDSDNYRLAAVFEGDDIRCVAGYRLQELLAYGKVLYVDDLITDETARSRDFGKRMLDWLVEEARKNGCEELHLNSGVQRYGAHRF